MLQALHIENVAVIRDADIEFGNGFSVLTGETGAGKSILIDSITFLLGQRVGRELLRTGTDRATVSALFTELDETACARLSEVGVSPDENGELLLQRSMTAEGKSTARANGRPVNLSLLRAAAELLVNIHGQSDTHTLTDESQHITILDRYAECDEKLADYRRSYQAFSALCTEIREISESESERLREAEMLRYRIADIEALSLKEGEEEKLTAKRDRIRHQERIAKQSGYAYRALFGGEKVNAAYLLERSIAALTSLSDVIPAADAMAAELEDCRVRVVDLAEQVRGLYEEDEGDPTKKLDALEGRLDAIEKLKRKYGATVAEVLKFRDGAKERLSKIENADERLALLLPEQEKARHEAERAALALHEARTAAARALADQVMQVLQFLDMPKVRFEAGVALRTEGEKLSLQKDGCDRVEFLLAANPGEPLQPLSRIASGGELSRIMLALKSVIADKDGVGTVIYDEIDTGVSGKTARKIGIELLRSARATQVFCVTHSAQIASLADAHYLIDKKEKDGRAETSVTPLAEEGRIQELSRILGGIEVTEAQRLAAKELYTERSVYKEE